jgi:hypothetical protein
LRESRESLPSVRLEVCVWNRTGGDLRELLESGCEGKRTGHVQSDERAAGIHRAGAEVRRRHDHGRIRSQHLHRRRFPGQRRRRRPR